jgi:small subunit ribosomal protein S2
MATRINTKAPELIEMLEAGVHFGHERSKKNPRMDKYIFMLRNRMAIIDLEKTHAALSQAIEFVQKISAEPNNEILFIGTKRQAREIVRKHAEAVHMPYVTKRWLGGTLTNFSTILKSIEKLEEYKSLAGTPAMDKMTKKEKLVHGKEIERLENVLEGIKNLKKLPAAIIAVGVHDERLAIREARRVGIPVVGIADTNADPSSVDYAIPANDDAIRSIDLIVGTLARAISENRPIPSN